MLRMASGLAGNPVRCGECQRNWRSPRGVGDLYRLAKGQEWVPWVRSGLRPVRIALVVRMRRLDRRRPSSGIGTESPELTRGASYTAHAHALVQGVEEYHEPCRSTSAATPATAATVSVVWEAGRLRTRCTPRRGAANQAVAAEGTKGNSPSLAAAKPPRDTGKWRRLPRSSAVGRPPPGKACERRHRPGSKGRLRPVQQAQQHLPGPT